MGKKILEVVKEYPIDLVVLEEVHPERGDEIKQLKTYKALMWLQAMIVLLMHEKYNLKVEFLYPSEWRRICGIKNGRGIKRAAAKEMDIKFVEEKFNINVNDDIADSPLPILLLFYFFHLLSFTISHKICKISHYKVTPCLKIAISWKPASSLQTFFPEATSTT